MTLPVKRIEDERLSKKAVHQLLMLIRSGQVLVSEKLPPESHLAEQFGISRGILRGALTILEALGFVRCERGKTPPSSRSKKTTWRRGWRYS